MALLFINKVPILYRTRFNNEVIAICKDLGIANPDWLMLVMNAESGIRPAAKNGSSTATGLIQFLESTANWLGTSTAKLRKMNHLEQLPFVKEYIKRLISEKGIPQNAYDLYFLVHSKKGFGQADNYVMYAKGSLAYESNPLDYDKDGAVRVAEVKAFLIRTLPSTYDKSLLSKANHVAPISGINSNTLIIVGLVAVFGTASYFLIFKNGFSVVKNLIYSFIKR